MTDKGLKDKVTGKVKEVAGDATGDDKTKVEGIIEQATGKVKEVASDIKAAGKGVVEKARDVTKKD